MDAELAFCANREPNSQTFGRKSGRRGGHFGDTLDSSEELNCVVETVGKLVSSCRG